MGGLAGRRVVLVLRKGGGDEEGGWFAGGKEGEGRFGRRGRGGGRDVRTKGRWAGVLDKKEREASRRKRK